MWRPKWWPGGHSQDLRVDPDRIVMVMWNATGSGGVARTVINLANHLARTRTVEVVSIIKRGKAHFPTGPRVKLTYLRDESEEALDAAMAARPPSVVITSRPALHRTLTRVNRGRHVVIGQDHLNFESRMENPKMAEVLDECLAGLDAFVVLTEADREDYQRWRPDAHAEITVIRNASPFSVAEAPAPVDQHVVVAAGRLAPQKAFHRLIAAWAPLVDDFPDWRLHICGQGPLREELQQQIDDAGAGEQIRLLGHVDDLQDRLRASAFYAMSSAYEGFPMVLVEAMSQGVPAIAYDCPRGPAEIITDGWNGRLVPDGDRPAYTEALRQLMSDLDLRRRMAEHARDHAQEYQLERIGRQWEQLADRLAADHNAALRARTSQ